MNHFPTAAATTTYSTISATDAVAATCHSLGGALGAVSGILRAMYGHVVGDAALSTAQILSQLATGDLRAGTTAPAAVRVAAAEDPATFERRGHDSR